MIFDTHIRGVRHQNGAEFAIRNHVKQGDPLDLRREPQNRFDKNAIGVWFAGSARQAPTFLGFVAAELAERIAPLMDRGETVACLFHRSPAAIVLRTQTDC
jgi:hypothetical protein